MLQVVSTPYVVRCCGCGATLHEIVSSSGHTTINREVFDKLAHRASLHHSWECPHVMVLGGSWYAYGRLEGRSG